MTLKRLVLAATAAAALVLVAPAGIANAKPGAPCTSAQSGSTTMEGTKKLVCSPTTFGFEWTSWSKGSNGGGGHKVSVYADGTGYSASGVPSNTMSIG